MNDKLNAGVDPYLYPGIQVLENKLGIHEANRLAQAEMAFTALRAATLSLGQPEMGLPHLCAIHQTLFQDIYPWAGKFREMDIYKEDTPFCHFAYIEKEGNALMQELEDEGYLVDLPHKDFCKKLAHYYTGINLLHPFRDGNGRAQRIFFEQLIIHAGYDVDWKNIDRESWLDANKKAVFGDEKPLTALFKQAVLEIEDTK
ncbi:putative adenosine monophosphate-protein transferase Fic [Ewingella sp. AOP8-B2-18]